MSFDKIKAEHRDRLAIVYVRQSTPAQVIHHRSSTERQFDLTAHAERLGWPTSRIQVIDEDLGCSARNSDARDGFQRLAAAMLLNEVGAVFILDASRLARTGVDWHRVLEHAVLARTLLIDEHHAYDPRDTNDRLALGMKGMMAEFELTILRERMNAGRWHLARRGAYRVRPPVGYVHEADDTARLVRDPDEQVSRAVDLVFARFRIGGAMKEVIEYFSDHGLLFPARYGARLEWSRLTISRAHDVLTNPIYAGAYVYGRSRRETVLRDGQRRIRVSALPRNDWPVMIPRAHEEYISWEEFLSNEKRMHENAARHADASHHGAVREGRALLQGLLLCGVCAARFRVRYAGQNGRYPSYACMQRKIDHSGDVCLMVNSRNLDEPIVELVLGMLSRERLVDATRVLDLVDEQDASLDKQWQLRLERARYDGKRAERQYDACDPDNRVVARTLEKRWNERLAELERLEQEYDAFKKKQRETLSDVDRQRIQQLANDLPRLWRAKTTGDRDRKLLLRLLIKDVSVRVVEVPRACLRVQVLWHTQAVTTLEIDRPGVGARPGRRIAYRVLETSVPQAKTNQQQK